MDKQLNYGLISDEVKKFQSLPQEGQLNQIQEMRKELKEMNDTDPDDIIYDNIDRANRFLDVLENRILDNEKDKTLPRLMEVASQLINAITQATQSIVGIQKNEMDFAYKNDYLKYLLTRTDENKDGSGTVNNNLIVMDI